jgi:MFS transporter, DHA1 family, multidrug resistance protein
MQPLSTDLYLPSLPTIAKDFSATVSDVQLTLSLFVAAFAVCQLAVGPFTDRFGRMPGLLGGGILYVVAAAICATAPDIHTLIFGRILHGLAVGAIVVSGRSVFRDCFDPEEGAKVLAKVYGLIGLVPFFAPIVGSLLLNYSGWRAGFWFHLMVGLALMGFTLAALKETNKFKNSRAIDAKPLLQNYWMVFKNGNFQSFTSTSGASFSGLFCFLSGSSFVLIDLMQLSPLQFGFSFSTVCLGYMLGTRIAARQLPKRGLEGTARFATRFTLTGGLSMLAVMALAQHPSFKWLQHPASVLLPMFIYLIGHGILQPCTQSGAVAPFPKNAGAASAMMGFLMNVMAAAVGFLLAKSFNGTGLPMATGVALCASLTTFFAHKFIK